MVDVSPIIPAGRQVLESYGGCGFRISGERYEHSVLVEVGQTVEWHVSSWDEVTVESLLPLGNDNAQAGGQIVGQTKTLLIGTGAKQHFPSRELRQKLRERGLVIETMDTGAACRTFNVLMAEGREVAAALIAVD
jgi:uncharacterized protein